mmetsp:Transcript_25250/g.64725  ORF Transcript_25250/g.64725 Transcript_25250/m.64725 type:complete len:223 (+) Transcript_25250:543-1211(+)
MVRPARPVDLLARPRVRRGRSRRLPAQQRIQPGLSVNSSRQRCRLPGCLGRRWQRLAACLRATRTHVPAPIQPGRRLPPLPMIHRPPEATDSGHESAPQQHEALGLTARQVQLPTYGPLGVGERDFGVADESVGPILVLVEDLHRDIGQPPAGGDVKRKTLIPVRGSGRHHAGLLRPATQSRRRDGHHGVGPAHSLGGPRAQVPGAADFNCEGTVRDRSTPM